MIFLIDLFTILAKKNSPKGDEKEIKPGGKWKKSLKGETQRLDFWTRFWQKDLVGQ